MDNIVLAELLFGAGWCISLILAGVIWKAILDKFKEQLTDSKELSERVDELDKRLDEVTLTIEQQKLHCFERFAPQIRFDAHVLKFEEISEEVDDMLHEHDKDIGEIRNTVDRHDKSICSHVSRLIKLEGKE